MARVDDGSEGNMDMLWCVENTGGAHTQMVEVKTRKWILHHALTMV
jgi:hypothetical protein